VRERESPPLLVEDPTNSGTFRPNASCRDMRRDLRVEERAFRVDIKFPDLEE